jgi:hypothetical protein
MRAQVTPGIGIIGSHVDTASLGLESGRDKSLILGDYSLSIAVSPDDLPNPCGTSVRVFRVDRAFRRHADWEEFLTAMVK